MKKILGYLITLAVAAAGGWIIWLEYQHYTHDPWTRGGQVRANVVGIAPRVSGPIIRIAVADNQHVKRGDLLFEIDPADFQAAVEQAKAQVMAGQAALTQRKQELERQTALFQKKVNALQDYQDAQDNYDSALANLAAAKANLLTDELKLSYTKICASVNGEVTNLDISEGAYASTGQQVMALVDRDSYWIAAYFKETQLRHIASGDTAIISLMGNEDLPFRGTVRSMGWGIFVTDGSSGQSTALLPSVSPTIDWVRLPQRFPVRIQVDGSAPIELRMGQTVSVAISHEPKAAALHNRLTSIGLPAHSDR
jgi:RND family efflux transporter MFP subunit